MPNNAASRLHTILLKAQRGKPGGVHNAVQQWAFALDLPATDEVLDIAPALMDLYGQFVIAEQQTRERFPLAAANVKLSHFPILKKAVAFHQIQHNWDNTKPLLTDAAIYSLENLSHDLESEPEIEQTDIDAINQAVDELFKMVEESDLNKKLKQFVMSWISKIRQALDRFRITGARGLQDALIVIQGEACFMKPVLDEVEEKSPTIYERVTNLFTIAVKAADFSDRCRKVLESPFVAPVVHLGLKYLGIETPKIE